jgi:hypothetical protein
MSDIYSCGEKPKEMTTTGTKPTVPEYLGCAEGYVYRRTAYMPHGAVELLDEHGKSIAVVWGVHTVVFGALPRNRV